MISIRLKLLGGLRKERQASETELEFPDGSTVHELAIKLRQMEINPDAEENIVTLSGRGLQQYPTDRLLENGEEVAVFPHIAGG